mmetsp:Transcript_8126/g.24356  ORF Transcript_8126/g.24356 Transcript_8126/m.24356 type:complete len:284 (-) Transcript_8126:104-955(-)
MDGSSISFNCRGSNGDMKCAAILCGTLKKRGYWNPSWKTRYFVLTEGGDLNYYSCHFEAAAGGRRRGTIPILVTPRSSTPSDIPLETCVRSRGHFQIEIDVRTTPPGKLTPSSRTYHLAADSSKTRARWLAALQYVAQGWRNNSEDSATMGPESLDTEAGSELQRFHSEVDETTGDRSERRPQDAPLASGEPAPWDRDSAEGVYNHNPAGGLYNSPATNDSASSSAGLPLDELSFHDGRPPFDDDRPSLDGWESSDGEEGPGREHGGRPAPAGDALGPTGRGN